MANITVLIGSPRKGGNTQTLAASFIEGAKRKNAVTVVSVAETNIKGCTGCDFCYHDPQNRCVQKDGMETVYEKLAGADVIAVATPVYFYGVPSQLKALIDRLHSPVRNSFRVKKLVLLSVAADTIPTVFDSVRAMYDSVLKYFSLSDGGVLTVSGVEHKGDIRGNAVLQEAYKLGESI